MKNNLLKYYIAAVYFCSTFIMFAADEPGVTDEAGILESTDSVPINDYVWVLALIGLVFIFMKIRTIQKNSIQG